MGTWRLGEERAKEEIAAIFYFSPVKMVFQKLYPIFDCCF